MRIYWIFLVFPFTSGCLGWAYPVCRQTPPIPVQENDVRAFRKTTEDGFYGCLIAGCVTMGRNLNEIAIIDGAVPSQSDSHLCYHYLAFPFAGSHFKSLATVLYRPGYEVVEIPGRPWWLAWKKAQPIKWKVAPDLPSQEKILDTLSEGNSFLFTADDKTLDFFVNEYLRLAQEAQILEAQEVRVRYLNKAEELEKMRKRNKSE